MSNSIKIKGARVHNLKNINVEIPRDKLVVLTGLSGSGKSSLAFDTIYAEGQRRYVESLSAYARQFIGQMNKPDVDSIDGLSPAISIDQKSTTHNPRSTVGTITEVYDYLRLLYARAGVPYCPECGELIKPLSIDQISEKITTNFLNQDVLILAPVIKDKKGEHKSVLDGVRKAGYSRLRFDKTIYTLEEFEDLAVDKQKKHSLEIVLDRLKVLKNKDDQTRLAESAEKALELGNGLVTVTSLNIKIENRKSKIENSDIVYSQRFACSNCGVNLAELETRDFSFNSPHGACPDCSGLGTKLE